jgi:uncharacterized protein (TIGR03435 family)
MVLLSPNSISSGGKMRGRGWLLWSAVAFAVATIVCGALQAQDAAKAETVKTEAAKPARLTAADVKGKSFHFEVASIRLNKTGEPGWEWWEGLEKYRGTNVRLQDLVMSAYGLTLEAELVNLPKWAAEERYDVAAKVDDETFALWKRLNRAGKIAMLQTLEQDLLAERCQFKMHKETRVLPVYELVVAKGGLKMQEILDNEKASVSTYNTDGEFQAEAMDVTELVENLAETVEKTVVDKTGLGNKRYAFTLKWTPDEEQRTVDDAKPSIYKALEEQLGLKLVPSKAPVEIVVVDKMERPSEN